MTHFLNLAPLFLSLKRVKVDPSAAEFRRRSQPARCRAAGKNSARRHASRNLLKPPPQFLRRAAVQEILTNSDTFSSFIMMLSNSLFGRKKCCNVVKPPVGGLADEVPQKQLKQFYIFTVKF